MKKITVIKNGFIQNPDKEKVKKDILVRDGKIAEISNKLPDNEDSIDAEGLTITPGLIDQHIHGGYGVDFNNAKSEDIVSFCEKITSHGVTSFVATVMTDSEDHIKQQIKEISDAIKKQPENSAKILGIHLEGPFLNPDFKGIHPDSFILEPNIENFKKFENENIKIVSFAPELDKKFEFTKYLTEKTIISSAGHSKATHEELRAASKKGLKQVTHLFNAMSPLHHRNPGILGEALTNDSIYTEVIADNEHLHPIIIDLILRAKPKSRIIFISDSLPLNQSKQDNLIFGGQKIFRKNNKAVNENGTFAGSLSFLDENLRKNIEKINLSDFLMFSSFNPATNLGLNTKGLIKKSFDADLVLWDENLQVKHVLIGGLQAF